MIVSSGLPDFIHRYRAVISAETDHDAILCCPACGCDNVHIVGVFTGMKHTAVLCNGDDAAVTRSTKPSPRSGSRVTITFAGECHHGFSYRWEFRQGSTHTTLVNVHQIPPGQFPRTLWRA